MRFVHVVALFALATPVETEAALLAADLGTTAYEERLKLVAGLPAIVLNSADEAPARTLCEKLRNRGHDAMAADTAEVMPSAAMLAIRRFAFEPDALIEPDIEGARLPYDDILALLRASHHTRTETRTETKGKQFSAGRAILSGGLVMRKSVTRDEKSVSTERENVLYVFRASGERPWLLRERGAQYAGLGAALAPSSTLNFTTFITMLRKMAPSARYDERLVNARAAPTRMKHLGGGSSESLAISSASGVDLLAHLLAQWFGGGARSSTRDEIR
ncbi:MAG TPA: hypothetical protein VK550_25230 [Polyangiaceae bacterium]|nr:hypothetical protein [Polyangiaceae bacterium]